MGGLVLFHRGLAYAQILRWAHDASTPARSETNECMCLERNWPRGQTSSSQRVRQRPGGDAGALDEESLGEERSDGNGVNLTLCNDIKDTGWECGCGMTTTGADATLSWATECGVCAHEKVCCDTLQEEHSVYTPRRVQWVASDATWTRKKSLKKSGWRWEVAGLIVNVFFEKFPTQVSFETSGTASSVTSGLTTYHPASCVVAILSKSKTSRVSSTTM